MSCFLCVSGGHGTPRSETRLKKKKRITTRSKTRCFFFFTEEETADRAFRAVSSTRLLRRAANERKATRTPGKTLQVLRRAGAALLTPRLSASGNVRRLAATAPLLASAGARLASVAGAGLAGALLFLIAFLRCSATPGRARSCRSRSGAGRRAPALWQTPRRRRRFTGVATLVIFSRTFATVHGGGEGGGTTQRIVRREKN